MSSAQKDTIYIDIDDEITSIIEKLRSSPHKIVALVLPKRAAMLQSIVNMKLLKRSADDGKKHLVLITSEAGLLPLAGAVGIHVAKTLQSKPAVPPAPAGPDGSNTPEEVDADDDAPVDASKPIGELAGLPPDSEETIEVDNDEEPEKAEDKATAKSKKKSSKKLRVPNFNKFRLRLFLAGLALFLLIFGWYFATRVMPSATIVIKTDTTAVTSDIIFTARTGLEEADLKESLVPAEKQNLRRTDTERADTTGQKNEGDKATGTMSLTNCIDDGQEHTVPAGTSFSSGSLTYVTTEAVTLDFAIFAGGECRSSDFGRSEDVPVESAKPGTDYNISARGYDSSISGINAFGSDMSGGTDKLVKVVSQKDVDNATGKVLKRNEDSAREELRSQLAQAGYIALTDTLKAGKPAVVSTPNVDAEADEVTISATIVYTMIGVKEEELQKLIEESVKDQIDVAKQAITNYGLDSGVFRILDQGSKDVRLSLQTLVTAGPQIDAEALKQEIVGKKRGETQNIIQNRPGVKEVQVDYSPFWVFSTPSKLNKINITIENINTNSDAGSGQ